RPHGFQPSPQQICIRCVQRTLGSTGMESDNAVLEIALGVPEPSLEPPPDSPAQLDPELSAPRRKLLEQADAHISAVKAFLTMTSDIYTIDVFLAGVANRSILLVRGFVVAFNKWNIFAAAP